MQVAMTSDLGALAAAKANRVVHSTRACANNGKTLQAPSNHFAISSTRAVGESASFCAVILTVLSATQAGPEV
ncbi:hypothetical protein KCU78_g88, partial [Aureobasidium melanogenum]